MPLPPTIAPQLLTPAAAAPTGERWIHEVKYDGYRVLCRVEHGRARLLTRRGNDWTARLRRVADAVEALGIERGWLDGEVVALGDDGLPDFHALHRAMRGGRRAPRLAYQVFDLLHAGGRALFEVDLLLRKELLRGLIAGRCQTVRYCDHMVGLGPELHAQAHALGLEGIVSKRIGSRYRPGVRSRDWLKVKCFRIYRFTIARVGGDGIAVRDGEGTAAGTVPVYSRRRLAELAPGMEVEVKALAWRPGSKLRHAVLLASGGME
jgi:bifunctional non-homologous end joining protein LigD